MKLTFVKISTTIFTFLIGVIAFQCWNILPTNEFQIQNLNVPAVEPITTQTSVCQLMDETGNFDGQLVSFQATAYVIYDGTIVLSPNDCYCHTGNMTFVNLELDSYVGTNNGLKTLLEGKNRDSWDDFKEVDVKIIGTAKVTYDAQGYKYYSIFPTDIKLVSSFRKFEPKGAA